MCLRVSGLFRYLAAAVLALLFSSPSQAASLQWEQLQGRERVTISVTPTEGLAGTVGRIAPTGVIVPFTSVPSGLHIPEPPKGASIIQGTKQQGRALIFVTQTPAFGFMVSKQTPAELVIDFFPDPLGARWKPSAAAPTTETPPDSAVQEAERLAGEAAATSATPAPAQTPPPLETPPPGPVGSEPALPPQAPVVPSPASQEQGNPDGKPKPVVVSLSGTPEHATRATQMATPPPDRSSVPSLNAQGQEVGGTPRAADTASSGSQPFLDSRKQTAERSAPLPLPEPPLSSYPVQGMGTASVSGQISGLTPAESAGTKEQAPVIQTPSVPSTAGTSAETQAASPAIAPVSPVSGLAAQEAIPGPGVGVSSGQGLYRGEVNLGGIETLSGQPAAPTEPVRQQPPQAQPAGPVSGASVQAAARSASEGGAQVAPPPPVIYTDDKGNPVEPPPDPLVLMPAILEAIKAGGFAQALEKANLLLSRGFLDQAQREELLHIRAEMLFAVNKDKLGEHFLEISDAANQAINYNPTSPRNAGAYLRLGYMSLKLGNIPDAEARFNLLRRMYPNDENVPLTYYYWGDYHFSRNELQKAADEFQYILQEYPNSRYAREAALGLARAYYRLGYYEQSFNVVDYVERRWERFYVEYPPFLNMMGDVAFRLNKLDYALKHYWLYVNLEPFGEEADIILTRIGDIYSAQREKKAAKDLYQESYERFPGKDGGLVALMRMAEEGVNDSPTISGMFSIFSGPYNLRPVEVYRTIISKHPESALVPLAEIKLGLWHLWNKEYEQTLELMSDFIQKYPRHEMVPKAREIAQQTFAVIAAQSMQDERYGMMREMWEKYPIVREQGGALTPEGRIALAVSYRHEGHPNEALQAVEPFFLGEKVAKYSEMALSLVLGIYLEYDQWQAIREVAGRVELWELDAESRQQLDYALALSAENLGESDKAAPLWEKLYESGKLPSAQMAYAAFFLARHAEKERELEKAYILGREALNRLIQQVERSPNSADVGKIQTQLASLMDVAETAGRLREALGFAQQYLEYLPAGSPERTAVRYRMSRIHKKQGDIDGWRSILTEIAAQEPASVYGQLATSELNAASIAKDAARYSPTGNL